MQLQMIRVSSWSCYESFVISVQMKHQWVFLERMQSFLRAKATVHDIPGGTSIAVLQQLDRICVPIVMYCS